MRWAITMAEEVKLLKTWSSLYGIRVVLGLKLKGIEYESIDEDLSNTSPLLLQSNPVHKKIPVLIHNGKPISESRVILEYIDETWTQDPRLLPQHPLEKARQRFWAKFNDEKLLPSTYAVFIKEGTEGEEAMKEFLENLKLVEEELKGKRFFGGDKIGLADLVFGWLADSIRAVEQASGLKLLDHERFPLICSWIQEFSEIPIIKENFPSHDKLVLKYRQLYEKFHPLVPSTYGVFLKEGTEREEAMKENLENLRIVEEELKGKRFFGGDKIGLTDLVFGWLVNSISALEQASGLKLFDHEWFPLLGSWIQEFSEISIIKENLSSHDELVVTYRKLY